MTEKEYREHIYKKAEEVKTDADLSVLIKEIKEYEHDYGTIVYGCMAAMIGAFNVVNRGPTGGITGFQAGCLGWEAVKKFMSISGPARIIDYENLLYPQYARTFDKTISPETWSYVQEKAKENLAKGPEHAHPNVIAHWKAIEAGKIPFDLTVREQ